VYCQHTASCHRVQMPSSRAACQSCLHRYTQ
jgi:hypothetical protein